MGWRAVTYGWGWAATCSACQEGYYLDNADRTCKVRTGCATCETSATQCTSCSGSKYLKEDTHTCVDVGQCGASNYADKRTWTCKACSEINGCTKCAYSDNLGGPVCSTCSGSNTLVKTAIDGSTTCVAAAQCAQNNQPGTHFLNKDNNGCILCSITTDQTEGNKGVANCKTCAKAASGSNPTCSECLDGYYISSGSCTKCADNCATCTSDQITDCTACLPGYFLKSEGSSKECVPCDNVEKGGREGCSTCSNTGAFKCTACKPNYRKQQNGGASDDYTCTRACEDETACGGTAGACGAIVVGDDGSMKYYCSHCGEPTKFPIDGICKSDKQQNTCENGVCAHCAANYFLYMGGLLQYPNYSWQPHVYSSARWHMHDTN